MRHGIGLAIIFASPLALPSAEASCGVAAAGAVEYEADSTAWIPLPAEELESPDRLEDRDLLRGLGARVDWRDGAMELRRLWLQGSLGRRVDAEAAWLPRPDGRPWSTMRLQGFGRRAGIAAGAVVARRPPVLLGEALGLLRPLRAVATPRLSVPEFEAPRGPSSLAIRGAAAGVVLGPAAGWGVMGRSEKAGIMAAGGIAASRGCTRIALAAGRGVDGMRAVSAAGSLGGEQEELAAEVLVSPTQGPAVLAAVTSRVRPVEVSARWRRRSGEARAVAGELAAASGSRDVRIRFIWRPWSARAMEDDGRTELEAAFRRHGFGPVRLRLSARGGEARERYVIGDAVVARERGRTLTILASRRESRRPGRVSVGSMVGGRLDLSARGRAGAAVLLQASRAEIGAPAWGTALAASGEDALTTLGRYGMLVTGRAWVRLGPLRLEGLLSDVDGSTAGRRARGTLRLELWRGEG
jgi:hypothetical protein